MDRRRLPGTRRGARGPPAAGGRHAGAPAPREARLPPTRLPEKVVAIHCGQEEAKLPHAIGGTLALAYYAEPRATVDIDINLFVPTDGWPEAHDALAPRASQALVATDPLDLAEIETWLARMTPAGDRRHPRLAELKAQLALGD